MDHRFADIVVEDCELMTSAILLRIDFGLDRTSMAYIPFVEGGLGIV